MNLGHLLRNMRKEKGFTLKQLEDAYRDNKPKEESVMRATLLSMYELGKHELSEDRLQKILMYGFNKPPNEANKIINQYILERKIASLPDATVKQSLKKLKGNSSIFHLDEVNLKPTNLIPVYSSIGAGFVSDEETEVVEYFPNLTNFPNARVFGAVVNGDSMAPTINNGDRVIILKDGFKIQNNEIYVFWIDGEFTVKRVEKPEGADHMLLLISDNPKYQSRLVTLKTGHIDCVGRVLEVHHKF